VKRRIKHLTRSYCSKHARASRSRCKSLENTLIHLERRRRNGEDVDAWITEARSNLELEHLNIADGARIRAVLVPSDQDFFINSLVHSLSSAEANLCDGIVTEEEYLKALSKMNSNKSPGVDGLSYEFYSSFWSVLGTDLVDVYNDCFSTGCLSFSQRTSLITLIYKKDDKLDTKNWRPISLLCMDYKILAKILTNRLLLVLPSIVDLEQTCGVPGRFSSENVRVLKDIIDYANHSNIGAAIISLDQEKAFDRVDWNFMLRVLEKMNFGSSFRLWVKLLYSNIFSSVLVNDYVSDLFPVTRGVRKVILCPLFSMY
jgi:hypothetical protein